MIRVENFTKLYGQTIAVDNLSFEVPRGAIFALVGQNGAGKTTTLRTLSGIIPPTSGSLAVDGHDIVKDALQAKKILAYVPDEPKLFETLTVWEHLMFYASAYQVENWESKAEGLLSDFELLEKKNVVARELSRGMRQKVAICSNFIFDPKAILFDEPHTGLDPQGIRTMKNLIESRAREGAAVIVSSHLLSLLEDLCTHILILIGGRSEFCGTMDELRNEHPDLEDDNSLEKIFFRATATTTEEE